MAKTYIILDFRRKNVISYNGLRINARLSASLSLPPTAYSEYLSLGKVKRFLLMSLEHIDS